MVGLALEAGGSADFRPTPASSKGSDDARLALPPPPVAATTGAAGLVRGGGTGGDLPATLPAAAEAAGVWSDAESGLGSAAEIASGGSNSSRAGGNGPRASA